MVDAIHDKNMTKFGPYIIEYYTTYLDALKAYQVKKFLKKAIKLYDDF